MRMLCFFMTLFAALTAWGRERVAVLDLSSSTSLPLELAESFRKTVIGGLEGAGFEVVSQKEIEDAIAANPSLATCREIRCLKALGTYVKASRVIDGSLVSEGNNFTFTLRLLDLAKDKALSQENTCDICNLTEASETLSITASALIGKAITESPPGKTTRVFIESHPSADVFSQRKLLGKTPLILELPMGEYSFEFRAEGFADLTQTVALRGEESTNITVDLQTKPSKSILQDKQALWGGVVLGALLVGGGVAVAAPFKDEGVAGEDVFGVSVSVVGVGLIALSGYQLRKVHKAEKSH
jgi:hypothetical protein